ncbi:hypothetical protein Z043_113731 [Scleropages formosus]|uniref:Uncharacterized protein n=1 Tax=Scleropages formosus TaxID=113540 RepID=A0A0P7UHD4_SCLFO|nr:hypothetical protein Z043_113731 [Scleropages formosus]
MVAEDVASKPRPMTSLSSFTWQTEAARSVLPKREDLLLPRVAMLLGLTGIGMSGYSTRQLTLHYKPSSRVL